MAARFLGRPGLGQRGGHVIEPCKRHQAPPEHRRDVGNATGVNAQRLIGCIPVQRVDKARVDPEAERFATVAPGDQPELSRQRDTAPGGFLDTLAALGLKAGTGLGLRKGRPRAQVFGPPLAAPVAPIRGEVRAGHHAAPAPKRTVRPSAHSSRLGT